MYAIQWTESADEHESLALCLRVVLTEPPTYDELVAALGLGTAMVAVADECVGLWPTYARDLALQSAAELYGLRLRDLHPPEAAAEMRRSPEYAQHFIDSYVPLIREALAHEQPVLAWGGWPEPREREWGLITADDEQRLTGYTLGCEGETVPLVGPAFQVYVVEECRSEKHDAPHAEALFAQCQQAARAFWPTDVPPAGDIEFGRRAYERWRNALACPHCGERSYRCVSRLARALASARRRQATWLEQIASRQARQWATACRSVAEHLQSLESERIIRPMLESSRGREQLMETVDAACAAEEKLVESW